MSELTAHLLPNISSSFSFSCRLRRELWALSGFDLDPRLMISRSISQFLWRSCAQHLKMCPLFAVGAPSSSVKEVSLLCSVNTHRQPKAGNGRPHFSNSPTFLLFSQSSSCSLKQEGTSQLPYKWKTYFIDNHQINLKTYRMSNKVKISFHDNKRRLFVLT